MGFGQGLSGERRCAEPGRDRQQHRQLGHRRLKSGSATFADVYASSRVGLGTKVSGITQRFTVGTINGGGGEYDIAIDGPKGMFRVTDSGGGVMYTRNGEFRSTRITSSSTPRAIA